MVSSAFVNSISVIHALDIGFNKGKGKVLETWSKEILGDLLVQEKPVQKIVSDKTLEFFNSLPKTTRKRER